MIKEKYEPTFEAPENRIIGLGDTKIGQKVSMIGTCSVIEKMKNYVVVLVDSMYLVNNTRKY